MPSGGSFSSAFRSDARRSRHERRAAQLGESDREEDGKASGLLGDAWKVGVDGEVDEVEEEESRAVDVEDGVAGAVVAVDSAEVEEVGEAGAVAEWVSESVLQLEASMLDEEPAVASA